MVKLICPQGMTPGSQVSVERQVFKANRDLTVDVPEPLVEKLLAAGFKRDLGAIVVLGTGGQTASLSDTLQQAAAGNSGAATPSTSQQPQLAPATPVVSTVASPSGVDLAALSPEEREAKIKADAAAVLAEMAADVAGTGSGQAVVNAAGADAQQTLDGAPKDQQPS